MPRPGSVITTSAIGLLQRRAERAVFTQDHVRLDAVAETLDEADERDLATGDLGDVIDEGDPRALLTGGCGRHARTSAAGAGRRVRPRVARQIQSITPYTARVVSVKTMPKVRASAAASDAHRLEAGTPHVGLGERGGREAGVGEIGAAGAPNRLGRRDHERAEQE